MISLKKALIFCVTNAENGTSDDCEEHFFENGLAPLVDVTTIEKTAHHSGRITLSHI